MNESPAELASVIQQLDDQCLRGIYEDAICWVSDVNHEIVYVSPSVKPILGYEPEMALGLSVQSLNPELTAVDGGRFFEGVKTLSDQGDVEALEQLELPVLELQVPNGNGNLVTMESTMKLLLDTAGVFMGMSGVNQVIATDDLVDRELQASQQFLRNIFDITPEALSVIDLQTGLYVDINAGFEEMTGWSREEIVGISPDAINIWCYPEEEQQLQKLLQPTLRVDNFEATFRRKDGTSFLGLISLSIRFIQGRGYVISSTRDIRALKLAEEDKRAAETQLLQVQKLDSIGVMASGLAHNFNNLLTAIRGNLSMLELKIDDTDKRQEYLQTMDRLIVDASELCGRMLRFGKPAVAEREQVDLMALLHDQIELFSATHNGINVSFKAASPLPITVDAGQIAQVMLNLFLNAAQAMDENGSLEVRAAVVDVPAALADEHEVIAGEYALFSVTDQGQGITPENLEKIFDPFFTTKGQDMGTGLGLASVNNIIRGHNGFIDVESQPGVGTTFQVYLPQESSS